MKPILRFLGAADNDYEEMQHVSDNLVGDPTLPFRRTRNGRFHIEFSASKLRRLEARPFILSTKDDFVRHDSGQTRIFIEILDNLQTNSVLIALMRFKALLMQGVTTIPRWKLDYKNEDSVCTLFHIRTVTNRDLVGEPALEGAHCDGVHFTMTTLLSSNNMRPDSATTFVHNMQEKNGIRYDQNQPNLVISRYQHTEFLDTLLFADNEQKHSLSPLYAAGQERAATRDMLIFFTRRPAMEGRVSHKYDSFVPRTELRLEEDLDLNLNTCA